MKSKNSLSFLLSTSIIFVYIFILKLPWICPIKYFLHINCPGCYLTRALRALFKLDIITSIKYNILGIPIFIFFVILIISSIKDVLLKEDKTMEKLGKLIKKYYLLIIIILIITTITNNIK